jgi:hypothetical protein
MKQDRELEPFGRLVEALNPWLREVVIIGGWAHRLYRLDARSQKLTYPPLTTLDSDIAVPTKVAAKGMSIRGRLLAAGFQEEFVDEDRPPATHYHLHTHEGFYVEFLTPLVGSEHTRGGQRKATREVGGVSSQQLRYVDILLVKPWRIALSQANGFAFKSLKEVQVANPASFIAQKILIQRERDRKDRAKDILYIHDTIEALSENLSGLREIFENDVRPRLHARRVRELTGAAEALFGSVSDTIRESARMASGRKLSGAALAETCRAGLREIFEQASSSTSSKR